MVYPVPPSSPITQTYAEHVARAQANGWCSQPGPGCATYYYGGIDWAVPTGTPIVAAQDGVVSAARNDTTGYGVHVRIQHDDDYLTIYAHLTDYTVKVGDKVKAGQVIGRSGSTGNSTGPHLHFELRISGHPTDPAPYLAGDHDDAIRSGDTVTVVSPYRLRAAPGIKERVLAVIANATQATVISLSDDGEWAEVQLRAWVHQDGIKRNAP